MLMESGCRYNLNLCRHADGGNQHPTPHTVLSVSLLKDQLSGRPPRCQRGRGEGERGCCELRTGAPQYVERSRQQQTPPWSHGQQLQTPAHSQNVSPFHSSLALLPLHQSINCKVAPTQPPRNWLSACLSFRSAWRQPRIQPPALSLLCGPSDRSLPGLLLYHILGDLSK